MTSSPLMLALWNMALVAALGSFVWLFAWALFGDRHFRSPRCPRCWHDMSGATSLQCSECGHVARGDRALHRRRRHWIAAITSLTLMIGLALHLRTSWGHMGWATMVPDRLAISALPSIDADGPFRELYDEVGERFARGRMSKENARRVLECIVEGDDDAPLGTMAWYDKYGRLFERWIGSGRSTTFGDEAVPPSILEIEAQLAELPPVCSIAPPMAWVIDEALPLELMVYRTWPARTLQRIVVEETTLPSRSPTALPPIDRAILLTSPGPISGRIPLLFEPLPEGIHFGVVRLRVEALSDDGAWLPVASIEAAVDVRIRAKQPIPLPVTDDELTIEDEDPDACFEPRHDQAMDDAMRAMAAPGLVRWARGERRFAMRFNPSSPEIAPLGDVAIGFQAEILEDGVVRRQLRAWWSGNRGLRFEPPIEDPEALARANTQDGRWTLRVRGVRELAIRSALMSNGAGLRTWWDGDVTIPLRIEEIDVESPPRGWKLSPPDDAP